MAGVRKIVPQKLEIKYYKKKDGHSLFNGIPKNLPSLYRAYLLTERASRVGFDWPNIEGVLKKMDEEMKELREALSLQNRKRIREEIGDLLFASVNLARFLRINPEEALRRTLEKFTLRFHYIETSLRKKGKTLSQSNLMEMDDLWEEAKHQKMRLPKK